MASTLLAMASNLLEMLPAMASTLLAMASNLLEMLPAMASNLHVEPLECQGQCCCLGDRCAVPQHRQGEMREKGRVFDFSTYIQIHCLLRKQGASSCPPVLSILFEGLRISLMVKSVLHERRARSVVCSGDSCFIGFQWLTDQAGSHQMAA